MKRILVKQSLPRTLILSFIVTFGNRKNGYRIGKDTQTSQCNPAVTNIKKE